MHTGVRDGRGPAIPPEIRELTSKRFRNLFDMLNDVFQDLVCK
jgi:hypothetical protein